MVKIKQTFRKLLIRLGFTLVNRHGYTVWWACGEQKWSNNNRHKPYSLDDSSWKILW